MELNDQFYALVDDHVSKLPEKLRSSFSITSVKYDRITAALNLRKGEPCDDGAKFKHWATRNFKLVPVGHLEYVYDKELDLPIAKHEELFHIVQR